MSTEQPFVIRYVVTSLDRDGHRKLFDAQQGQFTYATKEEAQKRRDGFSDPANNSADRRKQYRLDTLEVRACKCYPNHFDPMQLYFDE